MKSLPAAGTCGGRMKQRGVRRASTGAGLLDQKPGTCACAEGGAGTYDPAAPVRGHVAVHLQLLASLPVEEDGVHPAQGVSVHQMLGAVLRVREHPATCTGKEASSREDPFSRRAWEPLEREKFPEDPFVLRREP